MEKFYIIDNTSKITYYIIGVKTIRPNLTATITEYPVPEGGKIGDHAYLEPKKLSLSVISDSFDAIKKSYYVDESGSVVTLTNKAFKELCKSWFKEHHRLTIQSLHERFENMFLDGINWSEDSSSWSNYAPTLSFTEIKIAKVYISTINALNLKSGTEYSEEKSRGTDNGIEYGSSGVVGTILGDIAVAAGAGAVVGSIIPGLGTAAGAALFGAAGAVVGFVKNLEEFKE